MDDLQFNFGNAVPWFPHVHDQPYVLVRMSAQHVAHLQTVMAEPLRRCYITDDLLHTAAARHGLTLADVLAGKLPDAGSTMAGDFGEILGYFYQSTKEFPTEAIGPKKWRLKQDRTKPAPKSDVIHFLMPNRPHASADDVVLCSEVKVKSTSASSDPIGSAIRDCEKDRVSRLASTLVWLRERAMTEDLGDVDITLLNRFINAVDSPAATKRYRAVAVICESFLTSELTAAPTTASDEFTLVVISVPDLYTTYNAVFEAARGSVL
ncbi:Hachiman antiphage defense system protein HamA [Pseudomonas corrugata]|uniref:Hachiman antiphage defense system protein HamA n=1 Tax=Pseudomonas corrugata TaxID=47879 RepID=UPI0004646BB2|nr:Hachiman antiphage defense system protein HamA [Pseudomonas corrugata]